MSCCNQAANLLFTPSNNMKHNCEEPQHFLNAIFSKAELQLKAQVRESVSACYLDIDGDDVALLRSNNDELLEALEHLLNQGFAHRSREISKRIICDVHGVRASREQELQAMAHYAANKVRTTREPFVFGYMNANERRVVHTAIQNEGDLQSESFGEGNMRRLKISLKKQ